MNSSTGFELSFDDKRFRQAEALLLAALSELDRICSREQISYALYFEALAAAVSQRRLWRGCDHLEVILPRNDYRKLLGLLASSRLNERLYLEEPGGKEGSIRCHARLCLKGSKIQRENMNPLCRGHNPLAIDLLPMEYVAKSDKKQEARLKRILAWTAALRLKSTTVESVSDLEQLTPPSEDALPKSGPEVFFKSFFPKKWAFRRREKLMRGRKEEEPKGFAL